MESRAQAGDAGTASLWLPAAVVFCAAFLAYANTLANGFVFDDAFQVVGNPWIRNFSHLPEIFSTHVWAFFHKESNYYRPLMHVSYLLVYQLFGLAPWAFHLANLVLHGTVSVLVYVVAAHFFRVAPDDRPPFYLSVPFIAALLFAVHPIHTEVVAWVGGVPDLLCTLFFLLSLWCYVTADTAFSWRSVLALLFFLAAALCKETALTLPIVIIIHELVFPRRESAAARFAQGVLPFLLGAGLYFVLRLSALGGFAPSRHHQELSLVQLVLNSLVLFSRYLAKLLLPVNLKALYVFHPISSLWEPEGVIATLVLGAVAATALILHRRSDGRRSFFFLALTIVPLLPTFYIPANGNPFAERYLYLPSVGFVLLIGSCIEWAAIRKDALGRYVAIACGVTVVAYAATGLARNRVWHDDYTLWRDTVEKSPDSSMARYNLGRTLADYGRFDQAIEQFEYAVHLTPPVIQAYNNLGAAYAMKGMVDKAIEEYTVSLRLDSRDGMVQYNLANAYMSKGMPDEAIGHYRAAIGLQPTPEAYCNLAAAYMRKGLADRAIDCCRQALLLDRNFAKAHRKLGELYLQKGETALALQHLRQADPANQTFPAGARP